MTALQLNIQEAVKSDTIQQAKRLHRKGFNVFPQPYQSKSGFPWRQQQHTRIPSYMVGQVFSGWCNVAVMTGRTSRNLLVIDAETEKSFEYHMGKFRQRNLPLWVYHTARGGHIWILCKDGVVKSQKFSEDFEIRGDSGYVLCPPSIHPSGVIYTWLYQEGHEPPTLSLDELEWLPLEMKKKRLSQGEYTAQAELVAYKLGLSDDERVYSLPMKTLNYLECPMDNSSLKGLYAAACNLRDANFTLEEANRILTFYTEPDLLSKTQRTIHQVYEQPKKPVRLSFNQGHVRHNIKWDYIEAYLKNFDWSGRGGSSNKKVAFALLERAKLDPGTTFRASQREIRKVARVSINTVATALERLVAFSPPLIFQSKYPDNVSGAYRWYFSKIAFKEGKKLIEKTETLYLSRMGVPSDSILYTTSEDSTDAAEWGALNVNGITVYAILRQHPEPITVKQLSEEAGLSESQVRYVLRKLALYQVARKVKRGYWTAVVVNQLRALDELVAKPAGKLGRGQKREKEVIKDRKEWAAKKILQWRVSRDRDNFFLKPWQCERCKKCHWSEHPPLMCERSKCYGIRFEVAKRKKKPTTIPMPQP